MHALPRAAGHEIEQQCHLRRRVARRHPAQRGEIVAIKREDQVEAPEIGWRDLPPAQAGDVDAVPPRDGDRPRVGRLADMPAAGAC